MSVSTERVCGVSDLHSGVFWGCAAAGDGEHSDVLNIILLRVALSLSVLV